jgi:peptidoglycan/xylan/chitin deacetylase (PgdA/CDA1 family)
MLTKKPMLACAAVLLCAKLNVLMLLAARAGKKILNPIALQIAPAAAFFRRMRRRSLAILMYHGVTNQQTSIVDWCQVRVEDFRRQIEILAREYRVLPLHEVVERLRNGSPLPERTACLTFDDGFKNFYTHAWPILSQYQLPSTVFLVTALPDSRLPPWPGKILWAMTKTTRASVRFDGKEWPLSKGRPSEILYARIVDRMKALPKKQRERTVQEFSAELANGSPADFTGSPRATMNWEEIQQLASTDLVRFGSHTHTHPSLSFCPSEEQLEELQVSRSVLRERISAADNLFCYPFGDYTSSTIGHLIELGYSCGLTTVSGLNSLSSNLFTLRRVGIGARMTTAMFEMAMLAWYK